MKYKLTFRIKDKTFSIEMVNYVPTDSEEFLNCVAEAITAAVNKDVNSIFDDITCIMLYVENDDDLLYLAELDKYAVFNKTTELTML